MPRKATLKFILIPASPAWRATRILLGLSIGAIAGGTGALSLHALFPDISQAILAMVIAAPLLTGLLSGLLVRRRTPMPQTGRTMFVDSASHIGSLVGLHNFLIRLGLNRGYLQPLADYNDLRPSTPLSPAKTQETSQDTEFQYTTVTTITYDTQTNTPTSDTIARDRLASARLALLSMDHTKQIPH